MGVLFFNRAFFVKLIPINLLLMFLLLLYTQKEITAGMLLFTVICIITGFAAGVLGAKTGYLFGDYEYGTELGLALEKVPLIIGINWFIIIYCSGITIQILLNRILERITVADARPKLKAMSVIVDAAILAVLFDGLMEPVAVKLGLWTWTENGEVSFFNYLCWFLISALLLFVFHHAGFEKKNKFAINLLLIQAMFFLLLSTFL